MAGRVAQTRQPLHVDNYRSWAGRTPQYDDIALTAVIGVPMIYQGELIGVLAVGEMGTTTRQFAESDAFLLDLFAAHTASAVHNTRLFETVQRLATTDSLTGVHNRRRLFELGEQELARSKRFGHPLAAIMLDIDHFKRVNDTYGHALGDQALRMVTQQCLKHIRAIDIVGRYGGEEFVILLPETEVAGACMLAERLRQCVAQTPIPTEQGSVHLTISLGIDRINTEQWDLTALLDGADHALYAAKQAGRNRIAVNPAPHAEQASAAL
jgi:diguanylate cyclase (GGDEF)-like protein